MKRNRFLILFTMTFVMICLTLAACGTSETQTQGLSDVVPYNSPSAEISVRGTGALGGTVWVPLNEEESQEIVEALDTIDLSQFSKQDGNSDSSGESGLTGMIQYGIQAEDEFYEITFATTEPDGAYIVILSEEGTRQAFDGKSDGIPFETLSVTGFSAKRDASPSQNTMTVALTEDASTETTLARENSAAIALMLESSLTQGTLDEADVPDTFDVALKMGNTEYLLDTYTGVVCRKQEGETVCFQADLQLYRWFLYLISARVPVSEESLNHLDALEN